MCLQTTWIEPKIANADITVYKELRQNDEILVSPYTGFIYEVGKLYETRIEGTTDLSSFDDTASRWKTDMLNADVTLYSIGAGFHSALMERRLAEGYEAIYKCIIPKGSEYYLDDTGLAVSNRIQIIEEVQVKRPDEEA